MSTGGTEIDPSATYVAAGETSAQSDDPLAWLDDITPSAARPSSQRTGVGVGVGDLERTASRVNVNQPMNWFRIGMAAGAIFVLALYLLAR
jgi:hypothetical protein